MKRIETVIIGGGQAGLATSYFLTRMRREHVVLEQAARPASVWSGSRWDSFTLVTPNWSFLVPGAEYDKEDPNGFMHRDEVVKTFENYVQQYSLPIQYNTRVTSVQPSETSGYRVQTDDGIFHSDHVVIATGFFQKPKIPASATALSEQILQLPSSSYRNPASLPPGAVLVVGSAQSGCQIAEELCKNGRKVFLCTGTAGRVPRRYRGKDIIEWLDLTGFFARTPDQLPPGMGKFQGIPHISGADGGHTINLHQFAADGVRLLGHFRGAFDHHVYTALDLHENLSMADHFELEATHMIDQFIEVNGLDAPEEELPRLKQGFGQTAIDTLDCKAEQIHTVIWATGYGFDYSFIKLPVCDTDGFPLQERGFTRFPGLYFVGIPWMPGENTGFLIGFGKTCNQVASVIAKS